jgi:hypothetical protein
MPQRQGRHHAVPPRDGDVTDGQFQAAGLSTSDFVDSDIGAGRP